MRVGDRQKNCQYAYRGCKIAMLGLSGKRCRSPGGKDGCERSRWGSVVMVDGERIAGAPQSGSLDASTTEGEADPRKVALGARLRAARLQSGMTQEEMASEVRRKKNWLSDIERGRRGIDPHTLQEIAAVTGRPVEYFTNPEYDAERSEQLHRPASREDWELLYAGDPERAAAHASLDEAFNRAAILLDDGSAAGSGVGDAGSEPGR